MRFLSSTDRPLTAKVLLAALSIGAASFFMWASAPFGAGISPDSMVYLSLSHHMAAGKGASVYLPALSKTSDPLTSSPPLCAVPPAVFQVISKIHPADAARLINIFYLAVVLYLSGWIVFIAGKKIGFGALAICALFSTLLWRHLFGWVLSEPLYLVMIELSLLAVFRFIYEPKKIIFCTAAIVTGLIPLVRYTGVTYLATAALCILLCSSGPFWKRLKCSLIFGAAACAPMALWVLRNYLLKRQPGMAAKEAMLGFLASDLLDSKFMKFTSVIADSARSWQSYFSDLAAIPVPQIAAVIIVVLMFGCGIYYFIKSGEQENSSLLTKILVVYALTDYVFLEALLIISARPNTPDRYLLGPYTGMILMTCALAARAQLKRWIQYGAMAVIIIWLGFKGVQTAEWGSQQIRTRGMDDSRGERLRFARQENPFPNPEGFKRYAAFRQIQLLKARKTASAQ